MNNPYSGLPKKNFWRTGALETHPLSALELYQKSFDIGKDDKILTAGSCFAQHISLALRRVGVNVLDYEAPPVGISDEIAKKFGYLTYSARYANIYTSRQLLQILQEAFEGRVSPDPVWKNNGAFFDSMRPSVEPAGLRSVEEVFAHRSAHLAAVRRLVEDVDVFVFTFGLTECWGFVGSDWVFPTAPGTIAGNYKTDEYEFVNLSYEDVLSDVRGAIKIVREHSKSKNLRFLFTISPVPLTATYSCEHVSVATTYSKSVLRAVAGKISAEDPKVGYFPSYEMVTSPLSRGIFYDMNWRTVNPAGVRLIMSSFLSRHGLSQPADEKSVILPGTEGATSAVFNFEDDVACEEALLDAFSPSID